MEAASSPDSTAALIGSFTPFTAPLVMTIRTAHGDVAAWEIVLSTAIMVATVFGMAQLAARVHGRRPPDRPQGPTARGLGRRRAVRSDFGP